MHAADGFLLDGRRRRRENRRRRRRGRSRARERQQCKEEDPAQAARILRQMLLPTAGTMMRSSSMRRVN
jgi:hypothetical protein